MPKKKIRADSRQNLKKVSKFVLRDPDLKQQEIADQAGISVGTVNAKLKELEKGGIIEKTEGVIRIAKTDLEHLEMIQGIEGAHISEYAHKANSGEFFKPGELNQLSSIAEKKQKRYSLLMGANTNPDGSEKPLTDLLDELKQESKKYTTGDTRESVLEA